MTYNLNVIKTEEVINKFKKVLIFVFAFFLIFSIATSLYASAVGAVTLDDTGTYTAGGVSVNPDECTHKIFGGIALRLVYWAYGGLFDTLADSGVFELNNIAPGSGSALWQTFWGAYDSIAVVGTGLALMWTMISLMEAVSRGSLNTEYLIKMCIKFTFCCLVIYGGKHIVGGCIGIGSGLFNEFKTAITSDTSAVAGLADEAADILNNIKTGNIFACCGYIIENLMPAIAMMGCFVIALVQLIGRILELGLRTAFAPIGIADIATHGAHSPGVRYMKRLVGCAARGAAMYLIIVAGTNMMRSDSIFEMLGGGATGSSFAAIMSSFGLIIMQIIIAITMVGLMKRVDNILNDVFA